jgi:hypothetical protein
MGYQRGFRARTALSVALVVLLLLGLAPAVSADCPSGLPVNRSFEGGFSNRGAPQVEVANDWYPFFQDGPNTNEGLNFRPEFHPEDGFRFGRKRIHDGDYGQKWSTNFATHHAGVHQQVNVPANSTVTLSAWAQAWSSNGNDPNKSDGVYYLSVGIDPTGGNDFNSPNIVWSPRNTTLDQWVNLTVRAEIKGTVATVYLRGDAEYRMKHNDAYFDDICLTVSAPAPPPTSPPRPTSPPVPTATPTKAPMPTNTLTPAPTPTPPLGTIRVFVFEDVNGNGIREDGEKPLSGARLELLNAQRAPISSHTSDAAVAPLVLANLKPGNYIIVATDPTGYVATSPSQWAGTIIESAQLDIYFAQRLAPTATPSATPQPSATPVPPTAVPATATPVPAAAAAGSWLVNISGIILAVVAIGLFVAWWLLRKRL